MDSPANNPEGPEEDAFDHVDVWVFDLDNTLYDPKTDLFAEIDERMAAFIGHHLELAPADAKKLQKDYYHRHGTTLKGLTLEHGIDPHAFLDFVHDIDLSKLAPDPDRAALIEALPGRKLIFTNGSRTHAERVVDKLGLEKIFHGVFDIIAAEFEPKPHPLCYEKMIAHHDVDPRKSVMFEDLARNLQPAHALGMTTVWVRSETRWQKEAKKEGSILNMDDHSHIHHVTDDLTEFLRAIVVALKSVD